MDPARLPALLQRVRWHNVARAGALLALAAGLLLWPRLSAPPPALPPAGPIPLTRGAAVVDPVVPPRAVTPDKPDPAPARPRPTPRMKAKPRRVRPAAPPPKKARPASPPAPTRPAPPPITQAPPAPRPAPAPAPVRRSEFVPAGQDFGG